MDNKKNPDAVMHRNSLYLSGCKVTQFFLYAKLFSEKVGFAMC